MSIPTVVYKTHATGNDFLVYADAGGRYDPTADEVAALCDRHRGIGADGLIRLARPADVPQVDADARRSCVESNAAWFMDYRNADGSIAEMCGNGTRAITLFAQRQGLVDLPLGGDFALGTRAGVKTLTALGFVDPCGEDAFRVSLGGWRRTGIGQYAVSVPGMTDSLPGTFVDMGNPHVVAVLERGDSGLPDVEGLDLSVKPVVRPGIASGQNVEFVRVDALDATAGTGRASMRVHERGVGETLSCGTGLCATGVVLYARTGIAHWAITVRGGILLVDVSDDDVCLTGSAVMVGKVELL